MRFLPLVVLVAGVACAGADLDRDGLDDALEERLLARYAPVLILSGAECDGLPASFAATAEQPVVSGRDGTLYGQVFRRVSDGRMEIRYFHLWASDCGRKGHTLDTEHVSVLLRADGELAEFWYAAAHEDTVCDLSTAARAGSLDAEDRGARIWVSQGKHASFLQRCRGGCGGDICQDGQRVRASRVVNLGESGAPLLPWVASEVWPLRTKMARATDFAEPVVAGFAKNKGILRVNGELRTAQAVVLGGDSALDGVAVGAQKTGMAKDRATESTKRALGRAFRRTKEFLGSK